MREEKLLQAVSQVVLQTQPHNEGHGEQIPLRTHPSDKASWDMQELFPRRGKNLESESGRAPFEVHGACKGGATQIADTFQIESDREARP